MIRKTKTAKTLLGFFCLPTSAKAHVHELERSTAFKTGQDYFVLTATQSVDEGGYPYQVVLSADADTLLDEEGNTFQVDQEIATQHAQVRKNLPPRKVTGILRADGSVEGTLPPKGLGLPHWEYIEANEDGSASQAAINSVDARMASNKEQAKANAEAIRNAKKGTKSAAPTA